MVGVLVAKEVKSVQQNERVEHADRYFQTRLVSVAKLELRLAGLFCSTRLGIESQLPLAATKWISDGGEMSSHTKSTDRPWISVLILHALNICAKT